MRSMARESSSRIAKLTTISQSFNFEATQRLIRPLSRYADTSVTWSSYSPRPVLVTKTYIL
jgi:hypothetical protein